ncbi:MAG: hypothetical protein N2Z68_00950 [Patescibacteria group bacterium]|nr:hypothetical protein [Patescibacteria group bacterium]
MERHRQIQKQIARKKGKIEVPLTHKRRLDVLRKKKAIEIERSGSPERIVKALNRLKSKKTLSKELRVPQWDLDKAKEIGKKKKMRVVIKNISGTKKRVIEK